MAWKKNKRLVAEGFPDLQYIPRERCGWDLTLACLAYAIRRRFERHAPDLNAWAARHGVPASERYAQLGSDATVLWHGTSRERAERIREHGLFHFKGLWTTFDPDIAHGYCRGRSERFGTEGAVVCIVLDERDLEPGQHYEPEPGGKVRRFHGPLAPEFIEYVLTREEIRFTGEERAAEPSPWVSARLKRQSGSWLPVQQPPVRFSDDSEYSSVEEFARLTARRLLEEVGEVSVLELFSTLYALVRPWDALSHQDVLDLAGELCETRRNRDRLTLLRAAVS